MVMSAAMIGALAVSVADREMDTAQILAISLLVYALSSFALWKVGIHPRPMSIKEGFAAVGVTWGIASIFGALPYVLSPTIRNPMDAFFESVSGFTTTGATVLSDPRVLDSGLLFWRSATQWLGGLAAVVVAVSVLPVLGIGGVQLQEVAATRATPNFLTGRFLKRILYLLVTYGIFTIVGILLLAAFGMTPFQAVNHAMTTISTGGFSTEPDSIGAFGPKIQWVVLALMFTAGISCSLHSRGLRKPRSYIRSAEFRLYLLIIGIASGLVFLGLDETGRRGITELRKGIFTVVSVFTTTGHTVSDSNSWKPVIQVLVFILLFGGAMAGSATGGIKTFRIGILAKSAGSELRRLVRPRGTFVMRFGKTKVEEHVVRSVQNFFLFYVLIFALGTVLLAFATAGQAGAVDLVGSSSAVASALGNVGPALGDLGSAASFAAVPAAGRLILSLVMLIGRVEIFPVLLLFTRELWHR